MYYLLIKQEQSGGIIADLPLKGPYLDEKACLEDGAKWAEVRGNKVQLLEVKGTFLATVNITYSTIKEEVKDDKVQSQS